MTVDPALEQPRPAGDAASSDAITFAFGDVQAEVYGVARVGLSGEPAAASGLVVLFTPGAAEPIVRAAGGEPVAARDWSQVSAAGVSTTVDEPLSAWSLTLAEHDGTAAKLSFAALSEPSWTDPASAVGELGGMEGYEHVCHVTGTITTAGRAIAIDALGQRGHSWGAPDWDRIARARTLNAWTADGPAVSLVAIAPSTRRRAGGHDGEALGAVLFTAPVTDEDGDEPLHALDVPEPRLSTAYDDDGRQRRAGVELVFDPDGHAHRGAGEVLCGTTIDLGRLRLDCAFMSWRIDGHEGVARYDVLRRP